MVFEPNQNCVSARSAHLEAEYLEACTTYRLYSQVRTRLEFFNSLLFIYGMVDITKFDTNLKIIEIELTTVKRGSKLHQIWYKLDSPGGMLLLLLELVEKAVFHTSGKIIIHVFIILARIFKKDDFANLGLYIYVFGYFSDDFLVVW